MNQNQSNSQTPPSSKTNTSSAITCITFRSWKDISFRGERPGTLYFHMEGDQRKGISWSLNDTENDFLYKSVKQMRGQWIGGYWILKQKRIDHLVEDLRTSARRMNFASIGIGSDLRASSYAREIINGQPILLLPLPLPIPVRYEFDKTFPVLHASDVDLVVVHRPDDVARVESILSGRRATKIPSPIPLNNEGTVLVTTKGWAVQLRFDLSYPLAGTLHPKLAQPAGYATESWDGEIALTRASWPKWREKLTEGGFLLEGKLPEDVPMFRSIVPNCQVVKGWDSKAPNGFQLHAYQKKGVQFCAERGLRALIADEMGVGKTAQAIGALQATNVRRTLVVCPAAARYVWEDEIRGWTGSPSIGHILSQDAPIPDKAWTIVTYDLLVARSNNWKIESVQERDALMAVLDDQNLAKLSQFPAKIKLSEYVERIPAFKNADKIKSWNRAMKSLRHQVMTSLIAAGYDALVVDEAHRAKNTKAKRSCSIKQLALSIPKVLLLTGTPLRNNMNEAAVLLGYLDDQAEEHLSPEKGYTLDDLREYLSHLMIRRAKCEVLPELPEKIRQTVTIKELDQLHLEECDRHIRQAVDAYHQAKNSHQPENTARMCMMGSLELARKALGLAKVKGGQVDEFIADIIENKKQVVVFCAHHSCSDELKQRLESRNISSAIYDGRTSATTRNTIIQDFQSGRLACFIGGIAAAGEAITLTAADTVVFVELDWVPAAMRQAEDRIHRVGQTRGCHIIHLLAHGKNLDKRMADVLMRKIEHINAVLDEDDTILAQSGKTGDNVADQVIKSLLAYDQSKSSCSTTR